MKPIDGRITEYRIFEVDKYGNRWFEKSFAGDAVIQKKNAEAYVNQKYAGGNSPDYVIETA